MDTYTFLRELADSWVLLAMFVFFIGTGVWAFWPALNDARTDAAGIPFRNEDATALDANKEEGQKFARRFAFHEEPIDG